MRMNYQSVTGKRFDIDMNLLDAWQEIVNVFPELKQIAEWDCLQLMRPNGMPLLVVPSKGPPFDLTGVNRADMRFYFRRPTMLPTISVVRPRCLAYAVAWYIDYAYAIANYRMRKTEPPIYYSSTHECEAALELMMDVGFQFAEDYWASATPLERAIYKGNKRAAFARAFEIGIAAIIYDAGLKPRSCSINVELLDPDNPNRGKMEIEGNPYYAFAFSWRQFESWWFQSMNSLIHDANDMTTKFFLAPENMV